MTQHVFWNSFHFNLLQYRRGAARWKLNRAITSSHTPPSPQPLSLSQRRCGLLFFTVRQRQRAYVSLQLAAEPQSSSFLFDQLNLQNNFSQLQWSPLSIIWMLLGSWKSGNTLMQMVRIVHVFSACIKFK